MYFKMYNRLYDFNFNLRYKVTVICGESGINKTTIFKMIDNKRTTTTIICERRVDVVPGNVPPNMDAWLDLYDGYLLVIDEDIKWVKDQIFWDKISHRNIWLIFICRDVRNLKAEYAIDSVCTLHQSGKYYTLRKFYDKPVNSKKNTDVIITEDAKSGYQFFKKIVDNVVPAKGKDNIGKYLDIYPRNATYVVDGAVFGSNFPVSTEQLSVAI